MRASLQTVNLLALRLQWFEFTPTQASPKAILQEFKPFGGRLGFSPSVSNIIPFPTYCSVSRYLRSFFHDNYDGNSERKQGRASVN
jgi:hypothetical protein